jgi:hypothetical protein
MAHPIGKVKLALPELAGYGILSLYFIFKLLHFRYYDYTSDIFSCLQLSRDWLHGKPFGYENLFGPFANQHNCFILFLFFPLTEFIGCYGFFLVQLIAYAYAIYCISRLNQRMSPGFRLLFLLAFMLGPLGYYIYDDPEFGFNPELLYIPFGIALAYHLVQQNKNGIILWYFLLILIREDAIVLAVCIHLAYYYLMNNNPAPVFRVLWERRVIILTGLLIFGAGVARLMLHKENNTSRLACIKYDLTVLTPQQLLNYFVPDVLKSFLLILTALLFLFWVLPAKRKLIGLLLLISPLVLCNMVASVFTFSHETGSCFAPRVGFVLGILIPAILFALHYNPLFKISTLNALLAVITVVLLQWWSLNYVRGYDYYRNSFALVTGNPKSPVELQKIEMMKQLSAKLWKGLPVEMPTRYFKAFSDRDICFPARNMYAFHPPLIIVVEKNNPRDGASPPNTDMDSCENEFFKIYYTKGVVKEDICKPAN